MQRHASRTPRPASLSFRRGALVAAAAALVHSLASANPDPATAQVVAGSVGFSQQAPNHLVVRQDSDRAILNWQDFSIGADEWVQFLQPQASSVILNRVIGGAPSEILGRLSGNGRVFLVNPGGVVFGHGAQVDVGGLLATALDIADDDFLVDRYVFSGDPDAGIRNQGLLQAADGGFVLLAAPELVNEGRIEARFGNVVLASGSALTVSLDDSGLVAFAVDAPTTRALAGIHNFGELVADGGRVALSAQLAQGLVGTAVNNQGRIQALGIDERDGSIHLVARGGDLLQGGELEVSAASSSAGAGGIAILSGSHDVVLGAGSRTRADGAEGAGGTLLLQAGEDVQVAADTTLSAQGGGNLLALAAGSLSFDGSSALGAGGSASFSAAGLDIAARDSGGCAASLCRDRLAGLLQQGATVSLVADRIDFAAGAGAPLDGRSGTGAGGSLFLGIGRIGSEGYVQGAAGDIVFADSADALLLDGGLAALSGAVDGSLRLGQLQAGEEILLSAAANLQTGDLAAPRLQASAGSTLVTGALRAHNDAGAASLSLSAGDRVQVTGPVEVSGHIVSAENAALTIAAELEVSAASGDIDLAGPVRIEGRVEAVTAGDGLFARGSYLGLGAGGEVRVAGPVTLSGEIGNAVAGSGASIVGAHLNAEARSGRLWLQGPVDVSGRVGTVAAVDDADIRGGAAVLETHFGNLLLGGDARVQGEVGAVAADHRLIAMGAHLRAAPRDGALVAAGALAAQGRVESVLAVDGAQARGAEIDLGLPLDSAGLLSSSLDVAGPVKVSGSVGRFDVFHDGSVIGAFLQADAAEAQTLGDLRLTGTVDSVDALDRLAARGAYLSLRSGFGDAQVGAVTVNGLLTSVVAGDAAVVSGADLTLSPAFGSLRIGGELAVSGSSSTVTLGSGGFVNGAYVDLSVQGGDSLLLGSTQISGTLTEVRGGDDTDASGAQLVALPDGAFRSAGAIRLDGRIDRFSGGVDSGAFGADIFLFAGNTGSPGELRLSAPLQLRGVLGEVEGGDRLYAHGAFASLLSFNGNVETEAVLDIGGSVGAVRGGSDIDASGAGLWLAAGTPGVAAGSLRMAGPVQVLGSVGGVSGGDRLHALGALAYASANDGGVRLQQGIAVDGTVASLLGQQDLSASGAELVIERRDDGPLEGSLGQSLQLGGAVRQSGHVGLPEETGTLGENFRAGGILLDAGTGSLSFEDVLGDNVFAYFDADSSVGVARLAARNYLELVTASFGPTLVGDALTLSGDEVFLSANLRSGTLAVTAASDLSVFAAEVEAGQLALHSGSSLRLSGIAENGSQFSTRLTGSQVRLSGHSIIGDVAASLSADGLSVRAAEQIVLAGSVDVGRGSSGEPGDAGLLERLRQFAPTLVPTSTAPNAYFEAPSVALARLGVAGDHVRVRTDRLQLGQVSLGPNALFHLDPLSNLPFFTESVDVTDAGLDSVKNRLATEGNRIRPNLGRFNDGEGSHQLGDRARVDASLQDAAGTPTLAGGSALPNLGQMVLGTGLAGSTVAIGGSSYSASLQISDRLAVDVRPTATHFAFMTRGNILLAQPVLTQGQVLVLEGTVVSDPAVFYAGVREEIMAFYAPPPEAEGDDDAVEEKTRDGEGEDCD